jgi:ribosomal protein S10
MEKRVINIGESLGIILPKGVCGVMDIQLHSLLSLAIDEGAMILRPLGIKGTPARRGAPRARPEKLPTTRPRIELLRALDAWGMTKEHFQRLSHDGMGLGEFAGVVSLGQQVDPVTIERLKMCLDRRQTCKESWDATIDAVLAVRDVGPVDESAASGPHPTEGDGSDSGAA